MSVILKRKQERRTSSFERGFLAEAGTIAEALLPLEAAAPNKMRPSRSFSCVMVVV